MPKKPQRDIVVGDIVRRRFIKKDDKRYDERGTVLALGRKFRGATPLPSAKVQFKSKSRILWYFIDQIQLVPDPEPVTEQNTAPDKVQAPRSRSSKTKTEKAG